MRADIYRRLSPSGQYAHRLSKHLRSPALAPVEVLGKQTAQADYLSVESNKLDRGHCPRGVAGMNN